MAPGTIIVIAAIFGVFQSTNKISAYQEREVFEDHCLPRGSVAAAESMKCIGNFIIFTAMIPSPFIGRG